MLQTYSCIPMARIHRSLGALGEEERDKIEANLGPNLCLLLERVRASDGVAAAASQEEEEEEEEGAPAGEEEGLCATLAATANRDLSLLRVTTDGTPLNMIHPRRRDAGDAGGSPEDEERQLRQPEEIMLVCISTVKMLLTIQANKNNNKVRQYIDANDVIEVAESAEYMYFR